MKIKLYTKYDTLGASSRVRCLQYIDYLKSEGIEVEWESIYTNAMLRPIYGKRRKGLRRLQLIARVFRRILGVWRNSRYDVVWIQKEFLPNFPFWLENLLLKNSRKLVLDIDDAEYVKYGSGIRASLCGDKYQKIATHYDLIVAGNEFLERRFKEWQSRRSCVIPTVIDFSKYQHSSFNNRANFKDDQVIIGWIGSPFTEAYLQPIIPIVEKLNLDMKEKEIILYLIGASEEMKDMSDFIRVVRWSADTEVAELAKVDIGIMPLGANEWEEGKCSYKAIQFMGIGVPVVVSPTQANLKLVKHGENGYVARDASEWRIAIQRLAEDADERNRMGARNQERIKNSFSKEAWQGQLAEELVTLANLC